MNRIILCVWAPALYAAQAVQIPATAIAFEPNVGQAQAQVKFLAHTRQGPVWMEQREVVLGGLRMRFAGGAAAPRAEGEEKLPGITNYFAGNDRGGWHTDVPHFAKVRYREVYPGIDVVFYGNSSRLEYDFDLRAGADPAAIRLAFDGATRLRVEHGDLVAETGAGEVRNLAPAIRQNGKPISGRWRTTGRNEAGFSVDRYDRAQPLTIDPVLTYASFLTGSQGEEVTGVAYDAQGNIYITGYTSSFTDFPVKNALYPQAGLPVSAEATATVSFLSKFNPAASGNASLLYSTYFATGGTILQGSTSFTVAVDGSGDAYIGGTVGDGLAIQNPIAGESSYKDDMLCPLGGLQQGSGSFDCNHGYVAEFSPAGDKLLFSTYLGGSDDDSVHALAVDGAGNIYAVGVTKSSDFPIVGNSIQSVLRGLANPNAFVAKITPAHSIAFSTFFGAGEITVAEGVAVDASGNIYVGGRAQGAGLPVTPGAFQPVYPGNSSAPYAGFVAVINPNNLPALSYSTYLGGSDGNTQVNGIAADGSGNVYLAGSSTATDFPVTASAIRGPTTVGNVKAIAVKLAPSATGSAQLAYSTIVDGSVSSSAYAIALDAQTRMWLTGVTQSNNFPVTANAFQPVYTGVVVEGVPALLGFIAQIDPTQSGFASIVYATYLGGILNGEMSGIALDAAGKSIAVAGDVTDPETAVTASAYQPAFSASVQVAYLARFDLTQTGPAMTLIENGASLSQDTAGTLSPGMIFTIKGTGLGPAAGTLGVLDATGKVATSYQGVQVLVNNIACPLLYISATQINAIAPYEIASSPAPAASVQVSYNGVLGNLIYRPAAATNPGIFSFDDGSGQGAILNQDNSVNGASNAAARGTIVQIFATGEGQTNPPGGDGVIANEPVGQIPAPVAKVSVTIGGVAAAAPVYAGTLPGGVAGAFQIDVTVPASAPTGSAVPVVLTVGANSSPMGLTLAIK